MGPGVPEGRRESIFEMFVSSRPGGSGLGLFLARTAVERCGGSIRAANRAEGGTCFTIRLPLAKKKATREDGAAPGVRDSAQAGPGAGEGRSDSHGQG
ncbi:sensor histidine kinase, partial [Verrucomicrobiota bacterium]